MSRKLANTINRCAHKKCDAPVHARGYCSAHYQSLRKFGILKKKTKQSEPKRCRIEGCERSVLARELCSTHYQKWRRYGDPPRSVQFSDKVSCAVENCNKAAQAKGLCMKHYQTYHHRNLYQLSTSHHLDSCVVSGCDCDHYKDGYCKNHHSEFINHGTSVVKGTQVIHVDDICKTDLCGRRVFFDGYCELHWRQQEAKKVRKQKRLQKLKAFEQHHTISLEKGHVHI